MWRNGDTPFVIRAKAGIHLQSWGMSHDSWDAERVGDTEEVGSR